MRSSIVRFLSCACALGLFACGGDDTPDGDCPDGCWIDAVCYPDGVWKPGDACSICDPDRSTAAWSDNAGANCDDGLFCTTGDTCSGGACSGEARDCSDGVACDGVELCDETLDACVAGASTCAEGQLCDVESDGCVPTCTGCVIGQNCFGEGQVNPLEVCQKCDPTASPSAWSSNDVACDDGVYCNGADTCSGGACGGHGGSPCGGDACDEAADSCYTPGAPVDEPSCNAAGDVVQHDAIGAEILVEDCLPDSTGGACRAGVCGCLVGLTGDTCDRSVVYVDGSLDDYAGHTGHSWETAFQQVQEGLDECFHTATVQGAPCELWVADGTYLPTRDPVGSPSPSDPRKLTILLRPNVLLLGGFAGGEITSARRDPAVHPTILSGDIGVAGDAADNVYHVVTGANDARMQSCVITGGQATGTHVGGGMYNDGVTGLQVVDCTFTGNYAAGIGGGGMYSQYSTVTVTDSRFEDNQANGDGAGAFSWGGITNLVGCTFTANTADYGGGFAAVGPGEPIAITDCMFDGNSAVTAGGAVSTHQIALELTGSTFSSNAGGRGGAVNADGQADIDLSVTACTFENNRSDDAGGGLYISGYPSLSIEDSVFSGNQALYRGGGLATQGALMALAISDSTFAGNEAWEGGGLYFICGRPDTTITLIGLTVSGNSSEANGGGLAVYGGATPTAGVTVDRSVFTDNTAGGNGGSAAFDIVPYDGKSSIVVTRSVFARNSAAGFGGLYVGAGAALQLASSTIYDNSAAVYGGVGVSANAGDPVTSHITSSIIWGNAATEPSYADQIAPTSALAVRFSAVQGGYAAPGVSDHVLVADPLFVDAAAGDLHLSAGSPCIDAADGDGATAEDFEGHGRVDDPATVNTGAGAIPYADMGAFEYQP